MFFRPIPHHLLLIVFFVVFAHAAPAPRPRLTPPFSVVGNWDMEYERGSMKHRTLFAKDGFYAWKASADGTWWVGTWKQTGNVLKVEEWPVENEWATRSCWEVTLKRRKDGALVTSGRPNFPDFTLFPVKEWR